MSRMQPTIKKIKPTKAPRKIGTRNENVQLCTLNTLTFSNASTTIGIRKLTAAKAMPEIRAALFDIRPKSPTLPMMESSAPAQRIGQLSRSNNNKCEYETCQWLSAKKDIHRPTTTAQRPTPKL